MELTFLGTGTSQGIPLICCDCAVCRSDDPRDHRMRTSAMLNLDGRNVLIDATPELRLQCLRENVRHLEAILITHTHADHFLGLDDVRRFTQVQKEPIVVYAGPEHLDTIEKVFGYARADRAGNNPDLPHLIFQNIEGPFDLFGYEIRSFPLPHGQTQALSFRIGPLAYCTDFSSMPDEVVEQLQGLKVLVLGALRPRPHPNHLSIDQALALAQRINADQTFLVHMSHNVSHAHQEKHLPNPVRLAHDGLKITI